MNFTKEKLDACIKSMHNLMESLLKKFQSDNQDKDLKIIQLTNQLDLNDIPQEMYGIAYKEQKDKIVSLQILKPQVAPVFYFKKEDLHIFTNDVKEIYDFLVDDKMSPVSQAG